MTNQYRIASNLNSPELILNEIARANALCVAGDRQRLKSGLKSFKTFSSAVAYFQFKLILHIYMWPNTVLAFNIKDKEFSPAAGIGQVGEVCNPGKKDFQRHKN